VLDALQRGKTIEAIKLLRASGGMGLKQAKDVIDSYASGNAESAVAPGPLGALPADVSAALHNGNKIEAIRLLRQRTGTGLKEAKDAVEAVERASGPLHGRLSPGEVPRSGAGVWIAVALAAAAAIGYYISRSPS
jgi:ribosomal protein L7/L12